MIQRTSPINFKFRPLRRYLHTHATRIFTFEQGAERLPLFSAWLVSITPTTNFYHSKSKAPQFIANERGRGLETYERGTKRQPAKTSNFGHRAPQSFANERGATGGASDPFLLDHQEFASAAKTAEQAISKFVDEFVDDLQATSANVTQLSTGAHGCKDHPCDICGRGTQPVLPTGRLERPPEFIHVRPKLNLSKVVDDLPYTLDDSLLALEQKLVGPLLSAARARHAAVEAELRSNFNFAVSQLERVEAERDAMKSERDAAFVKVAKLQAALTLHRTNGLEQKKSRR